MYKQTSCSDILFIADPDQAETLRISTSENLIQLRQSRFFQVSLNTPYTEAESVESASFLAAWNLCILFFHIKMQKTVLV